jgi:Family of unknown function (DUF6311)
MSQRSWRWGRWLAAVTGLLWYLRWAGASTLDVSSLDWLTTADWNQHLLGWLFFRNTPWALPLGSLPNLLYPVGSTVGCTDSNPLVSVLLKPISGLLPIDFQFIGPWLATCFMLQGYFGARLAGLVCRSQVHQWLAGSLFAVTPVLLAHVWHDTLCAHWLILGLLHENLVPITKEGQPRALCLGAIVFLLISAGLHPYLVVMVWTLTVSLLVRLWLLERRLRAAEALSWFAGSLVAPALVFALLGYVGSRLVAPGYGDYSADLLTLLNPMGRSRLLPSLPTLPMQYEGFAYLGLGVIGLCALSLGVSVRYHLHPRRSTVPLLVGCALLAVFSLSPTVTAAGVKLVDLSAVYYPVRGLFEPFRSSGRFIWPLHYLVLLGAIAGVAQGLGKHPRALTGVLALALSLQIADMPLMSPFAARRARRISDEGWELATGKYEHLALFPTQVFGACERWTGDPVYRYALHAYRSRMTFNSGIAARLPKAFSSELCAELRTSIERGELDPGTVYVVAPQELDLFRRADATCGALDGDIVCVSPTGDAAFRAYLRAHGQ